GFVGSRELLRGFFGQLYRCVVNFRDTILQSEFAKHDASRAKSIGLDYITTSAQKIGVNIANNVGAAEYQNFAAILLAPIIIQSGIPFLDAGPHRPVVNDDALAHGL